jgi:hypothetical protein
MLNVLHGWYQGGAGWGGGGGEGGGGGVGPKATSVRFSTVDPRSSIDRHDRSKADGLTAPSPSELQRHGRNIYNPEWALGINALLTERFDRALSWPATQVRIWPAL